MKALGPLDTRPSAIPKAVDATPEPTVLTAPAQSKTALPPSRQGKKALTGFFDPAALKQIKMMAVTEDTTIQALLTEALNDLFKKHSKPPIA